MTSAAPTPPLHPSAFSTPAFTAASLFALCWLVYSQAPMRIQTDSIWSIPIAISVLREGNVNLDEYPEGIRSNPHGVVLHNGHWYGFFPWGPSFAALPYVWARHAWSVAHQHDDFVSARWVANAENPGLDLGYYARAENGIASFYVALAVAFFYLTCRRSLPQWQAVTLALVLAFGTSLFSTASRVLWQHGPSVACLAAVMWLVTADRWTWQRAMALGLLLGSSYIMRPTNALSVAIIGGWVVLTQRRWVFAVIAGGVGVLGPWCALNGFTWREWLPPYYATQRLGLDAGRVAEALAGNVVSPGRGLFIFSPVAVFALWALVSQVKARALKSYEWAFALILLTHWVAVSTFPHWWGGHSFGNRFFTDVTPYWAYFFIPAARWLATNATVPMRVLAVVAALFSVVVHTRGATAGEPWRWNDTVDATPAHIWDWGDLQFLR